MIDHPIVTSRSYHPRVTTHVLPHLDADWLNLPSSLPQGRLIGMARNRSSRCMDLVNRYSI